MPSSPDSQSSSLWAQGHCSSLCHCCGSGTYRATRAPSEAGGFRSKLNKHHFGYHGVCLTLWAWGLATPSLETQTCSLGFDGSILQSIHLRFNNCIKLRPAVEVVPKWEQAKSYMKPREAGWAGFAGQGSSFSRLGYGCEGTRSNPNPQQSTGGARSAGSA